LVLILCTAIGIVSSMVWQEADTQATMALAAQSRSVCELLQVYDVTARNASNKDFGIFAAEFDTSFALREAPEGDARTQPQLSNRGVVLNGQFEVVDRFTRLTGATATVFARSGDDFQRVTTSLKKNDGSRAVGTLLDRQHPAYQLMRAGKPYIGRAFLFGKAYMTRYEPIVQDGRVIGILYVGSDLSDVFGALDKYLRAEHPLDVGSVYTISTEPGATTGNVLGLDSMHRLDKDDPAAAAFMQRLQGGAAEGSFDATWTPRTAAEPPAPNRVVYAKNPTWNWVVVSEASQKAVTAKAVRTLTVLWVAGATALLLMLVTITWLTRRLVGKPIQQLIGSLSHLAQNDLTQALPSRSDDEIGRLTQSMEHFRVQLVAALSTVHGNAHSLASASSQIADSSKNLSLRTDEQIDVLKYTFTTMGELTAKMHGNAQSASQATKLALQASQMATRGGQAVDQIVHTMERINESAKTIAGIVSLIDGIAFQTNILALNAAVEAARAGVQGRGFAVVASEVRALAQRCASAAKDIKTLIHQSVEQVQAGVSLVDEAGRTISEVVGASKRVSDIIGEVRGASDEQGNNINQVVEAVSCLDRSTQQSVTLVADSAAAAQGLKHQADLLVQAISVFQLSAVEPA
jgi:methyl-accepting chemotaxis protein-2 (aspartate sensor receptor)